MPLLPEVLLIDVVDGLHSEVAIIDTRRTSVQLIYASTEQMCERVVKRKGS
jgi:hypothetical protein